MDNREEIVTKLMEMAASGLSGDIEESTLMVALDEDQIELADQINNIISDRILPIMTARMEHHAHPCMHVLNEEFRLAISEYIFDYMKNNDMLKKVVVRYVPGIP